MHVNNNNMYIVLGYRDLQQYGVDSLAERQRLRLQAIEFLQRRHQCLPQLIGLPHWYTHILK